MPADIDSLSNDLLSNIFGLLNANYVARQLSRVSKKWNAAAKAPSIWCHMLKKHFGIEIREPNIIPKKLFENVKNFAKANPLNLFMMGGDIDSVVILWKSVRDLGTSAEDTFKIPTIVGIDIYKGSYNGFEITAENNPMITNIPAQIDMQYPKHYIVCCAKNEEDITKAAKLKTRLNQQHKKGTAAQLIIVIHPESKLKLTDGLAENCIMLSKAPNKEDAPTSIELAKEFYLQLTRLYMQSLYFGNVKDKLLKDSQGDNQATVGVLPASSLPIIQAPRT